MSINELVKEGGPEKEIFKAVMGEKIDLDILLAEDPRHALTFYFRRYPSRAINAKKPLCRPFIYVNMKMKLSACNGKI
ncbi:MAG TPA: hypothetical protein VN328_10965 [Thermodesulfovibrionales bacterium]|nr:hypothetical protein [Thermodesulfovibrionales bacterium]